MRKLIDYQVGAYNPDVDAYTVQVIQGDGVYDVRKCGLGTLIFQMSEHKFIGLPSVLKEGLQLRVPKMPVKIFYDLLNFYRHIYKLYQSEVYVAVYYDDANQKWIYHVPNQTVHGAVAKIGNDAGQEINDLRSKWTLVLESHSHHTMTGHFSGIDDADQTTPDAIHLVIGNIDRETPSFQIRYALGKKKVDLKFGDIFDTPAYSMDLKDFEGWEEKVKKPVYTEPVNAARGFQVPFRRNSSIPGTSFEDIDPFQKSAWDDMEEEDLTNMIEEKDSGQQSLFNPRTTVNWIRA